MSDWDNRDDPRDYRGRGSRMDYGEDYGSGRDYSYSSARDYAAAGEYRGGGDRDRERARYGASGERRYRGGFEDQRGWGSASRDWERSPYSGDRGASGRERTRDWSHGGGWQHGTEQGRADRGRPEDRGFFERAGDEVRSWFGDEEAERRRERDQRHDERMAARERTRDSSGRDDHYHSWRRERIAELDRDYDEYRRENAQRFENEFTSWRTERQGQRDCLRRVSEHMEVIGSDGTHVGTVDKVRGDRIVLTKSDSDAGGHHHSIPSRWIDSVDTAVKLRKTAEEAKAHWRDEERSGAMFGESERDQGRGWREEGNLNRSFSGTYR